MKRTWGYNFLNISHESKILLAIAVFGRIWQNSAKNTNCTMSSLQLMTLDSFSTMLKS